MKIMETVTENLSPKLLEVNVENTSTPEQDPQIQEYLVKASLGPKIKKIRSPIVKSKIECEEIMETNVKYAVVKSNYSKGIHKTKQNISITTRTTTTTIENANVPIILAPTAPQIVKGPAKSKSILSLPKVTSAGPESILPNGSSNSPKLNIANVSNYTTLADNGDPPKPVKPVRTMKRININQPEVKRVEKGKYYDPITVKSFMEQQREVRRLKEKQETANRKLEAERKKKQLHELNTKQKVLITKSRHVPKVTVSKEDQHVSLATKVYRARKEKALAHSKPPSIADSRDRSKHSIRDNNEGMTELRAEAEAELRTTMILQEFESIVHRECLNVLKLKSSHSNTVNTTTGKLDKSSETTLSLLQNDIGTTQLNSKVKVFTRSNSRLRLLRQREHKSTVNEVLPPADKLLQLQNAAAAKIQAAFRGYQVRKIWREVEINERRHCPLPPRRISFYRSRPSQSSICSRRLPLMSPVQSPVRSPLLLKPLLRKKSAFGMSLDYAPYIPPPPTSTLNPGNLNPTTNTVAVGTDSFLFHPVSVPSRLSGEMRKSSRFEERFPTEALKQLRKSLHSPVGVMSPVSSDHFLRRDISSPNVHVNMAQIPGISDLLHPSIPTFSMVLKEKVRLLQEMQKTAARKSEQMKENQSLNKEPPLDNSYDSDSTQHASIILSSRSGLKRTASSTDVTITDDYIGPDIEAMSMAYNLRKSPRLSLESESEAHLPARVDVEIDNENDSTVMSFYTSNNTTIDTEDEESFHSQRRGREDFNLNRPIPSTSLTDFRLKVNEKKQEILELAVHASLDELKKQDKLTELCLRASSNPNQNLEVKVGQLQQEVTTMNANMVATFAKLVPEVIPSLHLENRDFMLEFAKCQTESLKATAEVQQWLVELRRSSHEEIRENRHQETVNIATAVYAAVEEANKLAHTRQPPPPQHVFQVQGVQTTDSLLQNENNGENYSINEFLNTSYDDSRRQEHELLEKLQNSQEEEEEAYQNSISEVEELQIPISKSEENVDSEKSVSDDETQQTHSHIPPSYSLLGVGSPSPTILDKNHEDPSEKKVKTIADILREAAAAVAEAHILTAPFKLQNNDISITPIEESTIEESNEIQKPTHISLVLTTKSINESPLEKSKDVKISNEESQTSTKEFKNTLDESIGPEEFPKSDVISAGSKSLSFVASTEEVENERSKEVDLTHHLSVPLTDTSAPSSKLETVASGTVEEIQPLPSLTQKSIDADEDEFEKDTLAESIASELDELSYQSDFISQEPSSLSAVYENQSAEHELTIGEASKGAEESKDEIPEAAECEAVSISSEKNTLEQSIASEASDEQEQSDFLSISSSSSRKTLLEDAEILSSSSPSVNQSEKEEEDVVITPVLEDAEVKQQSPYPEVEPLKEIVEPSTREVLHSPEFEESLNNAKLDMMELTKDQEKVGTISRVINKWCDRPRDIVDHVLVGEIIEESPSWTDYQKEEIFVKNSLTETVMRKAIHQTLSSISKVINSA